MVTLFSWGYWGWGNATPELIRAVDATERDRGFKPPIFVDIRVHRNVRAMGFADDAFEQLLPRARYRWFPRLGNERVGTGEGGIKIADPFAAKILLEEALQFARDNRRTIFFCACEDPFSCHRRVVAQLVLKEAKRIGRAVRIVEWPGGSISRLTRKVPNSIFRRVVAEKIRYVPLEDRSLPLRNVFSPWGTILELESNGRTFSVLSGPARFHTGWRLPIFDRFGDSDSSLRDGKLRWSALRARAETLSRRFAPPPLENFGGGVPEPEELRVLTISATLGTCNHPSGKGRRESFLAFVLQGAGVDSRSCTSPERPARNVGEVHNQASLRVHVRSTADICNHRSRRSLRLRHRL